MSHSCAMCAKLDQPGAIWEDETWQIRSMNDPVGVPGWMLLISKRHVAGPAHFDEAEARSFGLVLRHFERLLEEASGALRIYTAALGEAVPHVHVHMLPRTAALDVKGWALFDRERAARAGEIEVDEAEVASVIARFSALIAAHPYPA